MISVLGRWRQEDREFKITFQSILRKQDILQPPHTKLTHATIIEENLSL